MPETSSRTDAQISELIDQLTTVELAGLLGGSDVWHTTGVERLGIPRLRVTDGPAGARGTSFTGPASANVPCGTALAATWDPALVERIGHLLGIEARSKGARVLLAPTINLHRTPIGGRNFECMSEDPYLTARIAVPYVTGVQSEGVACCTKHFVGNDTELERMTVDAHIDERTLRELYLVPFEAVVIEAHTMAIMTAYNKVNGPHAADHQELLTDVLRGEWGFDGIVMSDWFGLHSTVEGLEAGLDLEMPGPPIQRGRRLVKAIEEGRVDMDAVRSAAHRMLRFLDRVGAFEDGQPADEITRDDPADRALLRQTAAASMVLLRNEGGALPLNAQSLRNVAVIGPNARPGQIMGGGSAFVNAVHWSAPLNAITERLRDRVSYARGCLTHRQLPHPSRHLIGPVSIDYHALGLGTPLTRSESARGLRMMWMAPPADDVPGEGFGAVVRTTFTPDSSGTWTFGITSQGDGKLFLDDELVIDDAGSPAGGSYFGMGKSEHSATIELDASRTYELRVEYQRTDMGMFGAFNVGALAPVTTDLVREAVDLAAKGDLSILIVGTNDDWEAEGYDRATIDLPGDQNRLISEVAAVSKYTVVVVNAGSPIAMPWLAEVDAVLYAWFPGQEFGDALADVLFGDAEPGGRLPVTFPRTLEDTPAIEHYPFRNGVANYAEGRLVGYAWYDTVGRTPLFPFGFGLTYTSFEVSQASWHDDGSVTATITNTGPAAGSEVAQVYARTTSSANRPSTDLLSTDRPSTDGPGDRANGADQPFQKLVGFARTPTLQPGEAVAVSIGVDPRSHQTWSVEHHAWVPTIGNHELHVGRHSRSLVAAERRSA
jgi:beta-glucosidase